jgi:CO/xanthine dehydrogenase FAD-binding subunit
MTTWKEYHLPASIDEALLLMQQHDGAAQLIAGGTDLILDMEYGNHTPAEILVDVTQIAGLNEICEEEEWVLLGAAVTHTEIERSPLVQEHGQALVESCSVVGGPQVRNVATIGGNVAHALPAADGTIGLLALDAEVQVWTLNGATVTSAWQPLLSIFAGPGQNNLELNQMVGGFRFRTRRAGEASAFDRIMRPQGVALPILGVAARLRLDEVGQRVVDASIAIGPAGPIPFRATDAEATLIAADVIDDAAIEATVETAQGQARLRTSRHRASKEYRHEMIAVLLRRVLTRAAERARIA